MQKNTSKKKVGILTFHYAHNFGAALQAYALNTFLRSNGYDTKIINYKNKKISHRYQNNLSFFFAVRRRDWIVPWRWKNLLKSARWRNYTQKDWEQQCRRFYDFQKESLAVPMEEIISKGRIDKNPFYAIIYGSDQIWDTGITGRNESVYWGDYVNGHCKKIAYGASIYTTELNSYEKRNSMQFLSDFYALAVREESLAKQLTSLLNRTVKTVVDPTLLIAPEKYLELLNRENKQQPYTLIYSVSDSEDLIVAAQRLELPIKLLHYYKSRNLNIDGIEDIANAGPIQFLELVYHSEYVITNSFHGTIFSILFGKKFCCIYNQNARIENLLKLVGLQHAHMKHAQENIKDRMVSSLDGNLECLMNHVEDSKKYLLNALS